MVYINTSPATTCLWPLRKTNRTFRGIGESIIVKGLYSAINMRFSYIVSYSVIVIEGPLDGLPPVEETQ